MPSGLGEERPDGLPCFHVFARSHGHLPHVGVEAEVIAVPHNDHVVPPGDVGDFGHGAVEYGKHSAVTTGSDVNPLAGGGDAFEDFILFAAIATRYSPLTNGPGEFTLILRKVLAEGLVGGISGRFFIMLGLLLQEVGVCFVDFGYAPLLLQ